MSKLEDLYAKWNRFGLLNRVPLQASLELTNRCNERCTHCYLESFKDDKERLLTLDQWKKILVELRTAGTFYLIFMGGEAMLSPVFWPLAEFAHKMQFHLSMITNGLKISSIEVAERLKQMGFSSITFSLYSIEDFIHDNMTQVKGSCEKTKKAIEYCLSAGIPVYANSLLTKQNAESIFSLYDWCIERNIELKVDPMVTAKLNGDPAPIQYRVSEKQLRDFYKQRTERWPKSLFKKEKIQSTGFVCNAAKGKCAITPYGDLLPCIEIREPLGNLKSSNFNSLWNSYVANKWANIKYQDSDININDATASLCDFCPGMSKNEIGDEFKVSEFAKMVSNVKKEFSY